MRFAALLFLLVLSMPALAWYDSTYEHVFERASYTESESGHSSHGGFYHAAAFSDYSRSRSFDYEYELERETVNRGYDSWRSPFGRSGYRMFGY